MRAVAMYLPQFHRVPENDAWWGEGFTEWTAVRGGEVLADGQTQPREPLDDNYYCLLDKETLLWQAELLKKYDIGLCFYHYYFKEGRKILEKPAELLLEHPEIEMPFCFCWANESWARTWSKIENKNSWVRKGEVQSQEEGNGILLEQKYGREQEWKEHFHYLLPFFKDSRYICVDGKPVLLIYQPTKIMVLQEMCWFLKELARKNGLPGLYIIGENTNKMLPGLDATMYSGPMGYSYAENATWYTEEHFINDVRSFSYDRIWGDALNAPLISGKKTYFGAFVDYDDTPRHGETGTFLTGVTVEKFEHYLYQMALKNLRAGNEFLFINAWNEWGEGMYLEPDKKVGFGYLEAVRRVMLRLKSEDVVCADPVNIDGNDALLGLEEVDKAEVIAKKYSRYFLLMDQWMTLREKGVSLTAYLKRLGYKKVAIYGYGVFGRHLHYDLEKDGIQVQYVIDRDRRVEKQGISLFMPTDESYPKTDAIIITSVYEFDAVWNLMRNKVESPLISLLELFEEV